MGCSAGDVQGGSWLDFLYSKNEDGYGKKRDWRRRKCLFVG